MTIRAKLLWMGVGGVALTALVLIGVSLVQGYLLREQTRTLAANAYRHELETNLTQARNLITVQDQTLQSVLS